MLTVVSADSGHRVEAVISRRAAALRALRVDGVDIVEPTTTCVAPPGMAGAVLVPWPNRVEGAVWRLDGVEQHLRVTEPELGNANHGLASASDFDLIDHQHNRLTLGTEITHPPGYPFDLQVLVSYLLIRSGIRTTVTVVNRGSRSAPVAVGGHPYLRLGDVATTELRLTIAADHQWLLDERHIPALRRRQEPLTRVPLTDVARHATFELAAPASSLRHAIAASDGREVRLTASPACRFTQLWVARDLVTDDGIRQAVAIEPMTAPPNALRSGRGLCWIGAGERWSTHWTIDLSM